MQQRATASATTPEQPSHAAPTRESSTPVHVLEAGQGRAHSSAQFPADRFSFTGNQARLRHLTIQSKLAIGSVSDPLEAEADRVAEHVMRMPDSAPPLPPPSAVPSGVLHRCACGGTCSACQEEAALQRKDAGAKGAAEAPPVVHETLNSPGRPLDSATRAFMETRFGRDFSAVRIHTDAQAAESARQVNSLAYTVGTSIVFRSGSYDPNHEAGRRLLAHELTHVAQQTGPGKVPSSLAALQREPVATLHADSGTLRRQPGDDEAFQEYNGPQSQAQDSLAQPLSWDELFHKVVSDQRAFLLTRSDEASNPTADPAGVGRGVGPDRTRHGTEVLAGIQILDSNGNRVAVSLGAHRLLPGGHAEEQALVGLDSALGNRDVSGGHMMVVVDQYPCSPSNHGCGIQLRNYARLHGLSLEVRVPLREHATQSGVNVRPRTASRGVYRTDLNQDPRTQVHLEVIDQLPAPHAGGAAPHGGGGGGGGPHGGGGGGTAHDTRQHDPHHGTVPTPGTHAHATDPKNTPAKPATTIVPPTHTKPLHAPPTQTKPIAKFATPKSAKPTATKSAPAKPAKPGKFTPSADRPSNGGFSAKDSVTISAGKRIAGNALNRFNSSIRQIVRENNHDPDLADGLDLVDKATDVKSFLDNPKTFTAQAIKTAGIQAVFDHFSGKLYDYEQEYVARFPEVSLFQRDPLGTGISLQQYEALYLDAQANLRLPNEHKVLLYAYFLLGTNEKTPEAEIKRRIAVANEALATLPDLAVYAKQYALARQNYEDAIRAVYRSMDEAIADLANQPAGFSDELLRRGDALTRSGDSLVELGEKLMSNDLSIFFEEIYAAGSELQGYGQNFDHLGAQFNEFADLVAKRRSVYAEEIKRLQARRDKINSDRSASLL